MLNLDSFHSSDLPYMPLPDNARKAALSSVEKQGFTPLEDYSFVSLGENRPLKANILAFAHPIHRTPEYTGLTVFNAVNGHNNSEIVALLARSAAPFHLIHRDDEFSFWIGHIQDEIPCPYPIEDHISYDQLDNALSKYEVDLNPQRIINIKQGFDTFTIFRDVQPLQLSLWAEKVTSKSLIEHFAAAVDLLRKYIYNRIDIPKNERDAFVITMSIQLLGAIILADTGVFGDKMRLNRPTLDTLMLQAKKKFERYFRYDLFVQYSFEAEQAYQLLQRICYAGFVPNMLRDLYATAYSGKERKKYGSYDTPLHLTRRIWKNIPIEFLHPQKRYIADMTCGWGSFLVAGYERLSGLKDMEAMILRNHLYGNDEVDFTSQLAGLGLLLATSEDSWNIDQHSALEWPWLSVHQPTVIVGNPPFEGERGYEKANQFLEYAISRLAPGGYLAMIMPRSFIASQSSPALREHFLATCDLLELWELSTKAFSDAIARTIVLFAQKREGPSHSPVRIRTIQPYTYKYFSSAKELITTSSGLVQDQSVWNVQKRHSKQSRNTHIMDYKTILPENTWDSIIFHSTTLEKCAIYFRGVTRGTPTATKREKTEIASERVLCLWQAKEVLKQPFIIDYEKASPITYPDDLQWPRIKHKQIFDGTKVILVYTQDPSWGQRTKVAIERRGGYYISDDFWVLVPTPAAQEKHITPEVLAAIVNWDVSNAWIIEHMGSPSIRGRAMKTIPFPSHLSQKDCEDLTQAVLQLEAAAYNNQSGLKEANHTIDSILKRAYHLDEATFARLRQVKEWDSQPQLTLDPLPNSDNANWFISGIVSNVDTKKNTITLWMSGFEELQTVQIVPSMPGWLLRPNTQFYTKIPRKCIKFGIIDAEMTDWGTFFPQPYTYMTEEELFAELSSILHTDNRYRV